MIHLSNRARKRAPKQGSEHRQPREVAHPAEVTVLLSRTQQILEARARALARMPARSAQPGDLLELVVFTLGVDQFGLETAWVREILRTTPITPLPGAPEHVLGLLNLRGDILPAFDLAPLVQPTGSPESSSRNVLVLGEDRCEFALAVDQASEIRGVPVSLILDIPGAGPPLGRECVRGATREGLIVLEGGSLLRHRCFVIGNLQPGDTQSRERGQ